MNQYVLMLSVGPVQGFIAAARRSRDLWSGSWLLSEMAKACAQYLYQNKAQMVFPYITKETEDQLKANSDFSVGNKIQVLVEANSIDEIKALAQQASGAAKQRFKDVANEAKSELKANALRESIWLEQVDDYVEVQSAWVKIDAQTDYKQACDQVASILAARKATRDFTASAAKHATDSAYMLPKSSLDGARETVLKEGELSQSTRRQLGLSESEQLDCAGVLKRLGGKGQTEQFTPITRVAADAWINTLSKEQIDALKDAYEKLVGQDLATRVKGNKQCYDAFPYDAQYVYRPRLEAMLSKSQLKQLTTSEEEALRNLQSVLKPIWASHGQPSSYGVLLLADGDRMGELLDKASNVQQHQDVTQALSNFAGGVADTMRKFQGHCIYAGGDDVLGLVPLHQAYACAEALAFDFEDKLRSVAQNLNAEKPPTLSVGLAICHINTPLGHIRQLAQRAEKHAKGDHIKNADKQRNALGISLAIRSGNTTDIRIGWDDTDAKKALNEWVHAYVKKELPSRIAYDTREVYLRTDFQTNDADVLSRIRNAEFKLMLMKARTQTGKSLPDDMQKALQDRAGKLKDLDLLANELIVARWLAAKTQKELGKE